MLAVVSLFCAVATVGLAGPCGVVEAWEPLAPPPLQALATSTPTAQMTIFRIRVMAPS
jgi:hypothetical protein